MTLLGGVRRWTFVPMLVSLVPTLVQYKVRVQCDSIDLHHHDLMESGSSAAESACSVLLGFD
jgi:hypothetical protein